MPLVSVQELIDAGVHFGHQARRWNPKMRPFIYGKRHNIHVINLQETIRGLYQACHFLRKLTSTGAQVLFLGTKRQIRAVVESESKRCGMPAITERWIGGTLTNYNTVRERLTRLEELEAMEADGTLEKHKKKAQAMLRREMRKIQRNLAGVRELHGLPGAIVVIDPRREEITMREAAKMNVPVVAILDTDCDPDLADITIPGNDDAMSSVQLLLSRLCDAVSEGRAGMDEQALLHAQRSAEEDPRAREVAGRQQPGGRPQGGRGQRPPAGGRGGARGGGRGRAAPPGGRLGRQSTGRFADRASGHSDAVSIGGDAASERDTTKTPTPEGAKAPEAPAPDAAKAPAPPAPDAAKAPEAPAPDAAPPAPAPEAPPADAKPPEPSPDSAPSGDAPEGEQKS